MSLVGGRRRSVVTQAEVDVPAEGDDVTPKDTELGRDPLEGDELDGHPDLSGSDGDRDELLGQLIVQLVPVSVEESHIDIVDDEENGRPDHLIDRQLNQDDCQATLTSENLVEEDIPPMHHLGAEETEACCKRSNQKDRRRLARFHLWIVVESLKLS